MKTNKNQLKTLRDVNINFKIKLSALWITLMLFYIYADLIGFYSPGIIEKVMSGKVGGMQITQGFLFVMAIWMAIPSLMVFLSLVLKANANRWVNIITGFISLFVLRATFVMGEFSLRYAFQAIVEAILIALILWQAWGWPKERVEKVTA